MYRMNITDAPGSTITASHSTINIYDSQVLLSGTVNSEKNGRILVSHSYVQPSTTQLYSQGCLELLDHTMFMGNLDVWQNNAVLFVDASVIYGVVHTIANINMAISRLILVGYMDVNSAANVTINSSHITITTGATFKVEENARVSLENDIHITISNPGNIDVPVLQVTRGGNMLVNIGCNLYLNTIDNSSSLTQYVTVQGGIITCYGTIHLDATNVNFVTYWFYITDMGWVDIPTTINVTGPGTSFNYGYYLERQSKVLAPNIVGGTSGDLLFTLGVQAYPASFSSAIDGGVLTGDLSMFTAL